MEKIKQEMTEYWSQRVEKFSELRMKELYDEINNRWLYEIKKYLPNDKGLKILDIGTGTGYFCFLLAAEGHCMTGVDLTPEMIEEAKNLSEKLNLPVDFHVMDAENLSFEEGSFDAIVTRNLTWCLPNLESAYKNWKPLLKKDGVLINFDADYCREESPKELPENHAHKEINPALCMEYEYMKDDLRPRQNPRPDWDKEILDRMGFKDLIVDTDVYKRIYVDFDEFYNPTPIFTIVARA